MNMNIAVTNVLKEGLFIFFFKFLLITILALDFPSQGLLTQARGQ